MIDPDTPAPAVPPQPPGADATDRAAGGADRSDLAEGTAVPSDADSVAAAMLARERQRLERRERERALALAEATERARLAGRRVLVVGLGDSGLAIARWCAHQGAHVTVADSREAPPRLQTLREACPQAVFAGGGLAPALLPGHDLVGWSQGLSPSSGEAAPLHAAALAAGVPVWGELEFFAREFERRRASGDDARLVAITGTNGKTTTTRLVGHLCRQAGLTVAVAGNIGPPALDALRDALERDERPQVWVLEVASYQLALSDSFRPDAATLLNLTQDHLDWHGTMADYLQAKQRIYAPGAVCVVNRDDLLSRPGATLPRPASAEPTPQPTNRAERAERRAAERAARVASAADAARVVVSFGLDAPSTAPGYGIVRDGGIAWLAEALDDEAPAGRRRREATADPRVRRLMPADAMRIRGAHNHANALAALALARAVGVPMAAMLHGLRDFRGEPHRCEQVAVLGEVEWYDDSKGTNVGATAAALAGLGRPAVLIAGGDGKGQDFSPLAAPVTAHAVAVLLIGRDAPRLRVALAHTGVPIEDCASLEDAVDRARALAQPGQAVLMSPACASWDMFRNYAHRAQVFVDSVRRLAEREGQPC
jgi:UDP-N-acetylmuramoylalanine--D-glutamate ligase